MGSFRWTMSHLLQRLWCPMQHWHGDVWRPICIVISHMQISGRDRNGGRVEYTGGCLTCLVDYNLPSVAWVPTYSSIRITSGFGRDARLQYRYVMISLAAIVEHNSNRSVRCILWTSVSSIDDKRTITGYTLYLEKGYHFYFCNNFGKCRPILIILLLLYSQIYCWGRWY